MERIVETTVDGQTIREQFTSAVSIVSVQELEQKAIKLVRQLEQLVQYLEQTAREGTQTENENYSRRGVDAARICGNGQGQAYLAHRIAGKLALILEG